MVVTDILMVDDTNTCASMSDSWMLATRWTSPTAAKVS